MEKVEKHWLVTSLVKKKLFEPFLVLPTLENSSYFATLSLDGRVEKVEKH